MYASLIMLAVTLPVVDLATNDVVRRINGSDSTIRFSRFLDYPPSKGKLGVPRCLFEKPFPANPHFWLKGVDFSCASPWSDDAGTLRAGTLISKRHVIFAKHFPLWAGVRIVFVGEDGEVCPCRIKATKALEKCDIMIGLLDYEVTPNIRPAKILPDDYAKYIGDAKGLPVVTFNKHEQAFLSLLDGPSPKGFKNVPPNDSRWKLFAGSLVMGDSGNPAFLLIGSNPILLYCVSSGCAGAGPSVFHRRKEIQKAMDELCPGYRLQAFDFSKLISNGSPH